MQRDVELNSALGSRKSQCGPGSEIKERNHPVPDCSGLSL